MRFELERRPFSTTDGLIVGTTQWLEADEPALALLEENRMTEDLRSDHRWQIIFVNRGKRMLEFPRDLGPIEKFKEVESFLLFSGGEDSVASLMDMADAERESKVLAGMLRIKAESSTLIEDAAQLLEQKRTLVQRNGRTLRTQYGISHERKVF